MNSRGKTPPAVQARVALEPLKSQKTDGRSPEQEKRKRAEDEEKGKEKEKGTEIRPQSSMQAAKEPCPVPDLRAQAGEIERRVLAFCLDPNKKINKEQTAIIMRHFKDMRGIVEELLLHNSYLNGKLEQCSSTGKKDAAILSAVNKTLQTSKRLETAVKTRTETKQTSYAEKVKMISNKVGQIAIKPPKNVVIIRPESKESDITSSEKAQEVVFSLVNPRKNGMQVTAVKKINGNGLVVETTNPEGLKAFTENDKLKEAGLKASTPQRRLPRVILYDVPRDIPEKELLGCMRKQNQDRLTDEDVAAVKFCFRTGRKDSQETNWVLEVPPQVRDKLITGKIFISWNACKVSDYIFASRCYKCQGYGHIAKHCRLNYEICAHCAESGHSTKQCTSKDKNASCVNCRKAGKKGDHAASNSDCPMYKKALEIIISRTSYE
jgi:hypothetical protein